MAPEFTVNDFDATTPTPIFVIKRLPNQQSKSRVEASIERAEEEYAQQIRQLITAFE